MIALMVGLGGMRVVELSSLEARMRSNRASTLSNHAPCTSRGSKGHPLCTWPTSSPQLWLHACAIGWLNSLKRIHINGEVMECNVRSMLHAQTLHTGAW